MRHLLAARPNQTVITHSAVRLLSPYLDPPCSRLCQLPAWFALMLYGSFALNLRGREFYDFTGCKRAHSTPQALCARFMREIEIKIPTSTSASARARATCVSGSNLLSSPIAPDVCGWLPVWAWQFGCSIENLDDFFFCSCLYIYIYERCRVYWVKMDRKITRDNQASKQQFCYAAFFFPFKAWAYRSALLSQFMRVVKA